MASCEGRSGTARPLTAAGTRKQRRFPTNEQLWGGRNRARRSCREREAGADGRKGCGPTAGQGRAARPAQLPGSCRNPTPIPTPTPTLTPAQPSPAPLPDGRYLRRGSAQGGAETATPQAGRHPAADDGGRHS